MAASNYTAFKELGFSPVQIVCMVSHLKQALSQCMNHIYANKSMGLLITAIFFPVLKEGYRFFTPDSDYPLNSSTFSVDNMTCQLYDINTSNNSTLYSIFSSS